MIRAGSRNRKITIERATVTSDAIGQVITSWAAYKTLWAQVIPVSGAEIVRAGRVTASRVARFVIPFLDLIETDRINYGGDTYNVQHIREINFREGLELLAERAE